MKKMSRLLSILLLIAMVFSLASVSAFAASEDGSTGVIFDETGTDAAGGSANGNVSVSADAADGVDGVKNSGAGTATTETEDEDTVPVEAGSQYSVLSTSANALEYFTSEKMAEENPIIYNNAKYIVYIREHMEELKETNPDVVETAYALFGAEYLEMEFGTTTTVVSKVVALKTQAEYLSKIVAKLEALKSDPTDADGIVALRKETSAYRDTFSGVANYDYTDEESAFYSTGLEAALEAANTELANIQAQITKLENNEEESEEDKDEEKKDETEAEAEASPTPSPTTTPTPNEALESPAPTATADPAVEVSPSPSPSATPVEQEAENKETDNDTATATETETENTDSAEAAASVTPPVLMSPIEIFKKLLGTVQTSAASLAGQTTYLTDTVVITGLPDWPIIATLDNAKIYSPSGKYAFAIGSAETVVTLEAATVYGKLIDVSQGNVTLKYIKAVDTTSGTGTAYIHGGQLEIGNCEIDSSAEPCVYSLSGLTKINGYNKIGCSSGDCPAVYAGGGQIDIDNTETTQSIISSASNNGIRIDGGIVNASGCAKISGLNGVYVASGAYTQSNSVRVDGIGKGETYGAVNNQAGEVYIAGGSLYAEYGKAIISPTATKTFVANGEEIIVTSKYSCSDQYTTGMITVDDDPQLTVTDVNTKISDGKDHVVKLLGDVTSGVGLKIDTAGNITFNGNGHTLKVTAGAGIEVINGSLSLTKVSVEVASTEGCIYVHGSSKTACTVNIGEGVIGKAGTNALNVQGGTVYVNGMTMYCTNGILAQDASKTAVTVNSCKDNAANMINASTTKDGALVILGGYFLTKGTTGGVMVEDFLLKGVSTISTTTNSDGYYVVTMEYNPTVEILNGTTGTDENGIPYVVYDKSSPKYVTFDVDPKVLRIDAVPLESGTSMNVFNNETKGGTEGEITIDFDAFQNNLACGVYDLQFKFKNGYVMTGKLHLYVLPEVTKLVARSNYEDASPYAETSKGGSWKASDIETAVTEYRVGAKQYVYARVSELPTKIGVSSDSTGANVNWFGYYNKAVDGKTVFQQDESKDYFILLDYAFLDQLSAGQDYIFMNYNGAIKRLSLKIVNDNVKITPTTMSFWGTDTNAVFTVTPDYKDVYIDGELVPTAFVKYDKDTHKLTIGGEYLNKIPSGEHLMEVETSQGWLSATVHTGVGLKPVDVDYHVYGGAKALAFMASDEIDTTAGIYIGKNNPTKVDSTLIYYYNNDTRFTISPSYLNRLSIGTYYLSAYVWNGDAYEYTSTTFRIVSASSAAYNPGTGDTFSPILWIGIAVVAAAVIAVILVPTLKKKSGKQEESIQEAAPAEETQAVDAEETPTEPAPVTQEEPENKKE